MGGLGYSAQFVHLDADVDETPVAASPGQPAGDTSGALAEPAEEAQDYSVLRGREEVLQIVPNSACTL
eukprot:COSAG01_NODE_3542_length_5957_cov_14.346876_3_plen_68_part_00